MPALLRRPACPVLGPALRRNIAAIGKHGQARSANSKCPRFQGNPGPVSPKAANVRLGLRLILRRSGLPCESLSRSGAGMHTRSEPPPALVDRQPERRALDGLVQDLRSGRGWAWRDGSPGSMRAAITGPPCSVSTWPQAGQQREHGPVLGADFGGGYSIPASRARSLSRAASAEPSRRPCQASITVTRPPRCRAGPTASATVRSAFFATERGACPQHPDRRWRVRHNPC